MRPKKLSPKKIRKLRRQGRLRDEFEIWVDRHNHKVNYLSVKDGEVWTGPSSAEDSRLGEVCRI